VNPPAARPMSNAEGSAPPSRELSLVEVRAEKGRLIKRVAEGGAQELVSRGWAEWIGTGGRRYVSLTAAAPMSERHGWRGGSHTTRAIRADGRGDLARGQLLGDPNSHQEFIPNR